jgi:hypothetical protein
MQVEQQSAESKTKPPSISALQQTQCYTVSVQLLGFGTRSEHSVASIVPQRPIHKEGVPTVSSQSAHHPLSS